MGIESISKINGNMFFAVSAIRLGGNNLTDETIKKLKELGIDPTTVKSEEEAKALIAQAKQQRANHKAQQVQPQMASANVDMVKLDMDIKELGDKLNIDVKMFKKLTELVDKFDATVKEYEIAAAAQSNQNIFQKIDKQNENKISTGAPIIDKPETVKAEFYAIKERVEKIEETKKTNFAALDMVAAMNKLSLGL